MDEVWVPTAFHQSIFMRDARMSAEQVRVVPEPVDTVWFDPALSAAGAASAEWILPHKHTRFVSVFKWEHRKGWDVLLSSWWSAFTRADAVALYIRTSAYHSSDDFQGALLAHLISAHGCTDATATIMSREAHSPQWCFDATAEDELPAHHTATPQHRSLRDLPAVVFIPELSESGLRDMYAMADCFVLPSRGEGWGRPHVEAMAMQLPVIATAWSGPTAFMTAQNSLPLRFTHIKALQSGPFIGHGFAEPDGEHLSELMQWVHKNPSQAAALGRKAREHMKRHFSQEAVTQVVRANIERIAAKNNSAPAKARRNEDL
jgi:hypothetical protein